MIKRRKRGTGTNDARIRVGDRPTREAELEGLPTNREIGRGLGVSKQMTSLILREGLKSAHLRLVTEAVERELGGWELDAVVDVVVYVIRNDLGYGLVSGSLSLVDVLDMLDGEEMDTQKAS